MKASVSNNRSILSVMGEQLEHYNGSFTCSYKNLTSLEGAPSHIEGKLICHNNNLTSLHNIHKHIKHISSSAFFKNNPIKSHVLGLLLIDGLKSVWIDNVKVDFIINKHLANDRDAFTCQEELIEAGFDEFAQL